MRKIVYIIFLFISSIVFSQSSQSKNLDQDIVEYVFHFKYTPENLAILKEKIENYENHIKNSKSKIQEINLLYAKTRYDIFTNDGVHIDLCISYCDRIISLSKEVNVDKRILSSIYMTRAMYYTYNNEDHDLVMRDFNQAIALANNIPNKEYRFDRLGVIYGRMGDFYQDLHDYEAALRYKKLCLHYISKIDSKKYLVPNEKLRIAEVYLKAYRDFKNKKYFDSANSILNMQLEKGNIKHTSDAFALKAYGSLLDHDYDGVINNIDSSFQKKYHAQSEMLYIRDDFRNGLLAIAYFQKQNSEKASKYLSKTIIENPNFLLAQTLYQELYIQAKKQNKYKEALEFYEKHNEIQKQNYFLDNQLQLRKFKEKMKVAEKDTELIKLQNNKKSLTITIIAVVNLLIIAIVLSVIYSRKRTKKLKKVEQEIKSFTENEINKINFAKEQATNDLKKQFSTQLHNDVGSILVATSSFLKSKKKIETDPEDLELWDDITSELQNVYTIIRGGSHEIYNSTSDNEKFLSDLEKNIRVIFSGQSITLYSNVNIEKDKNLTPEIKLCILSIIKEGCTNILKYASAKNVIIDLTNDSNSIFLEISNDNKRRSAKKQISLGIGLLNLKEQIEKLNGIFTSNYTSDGFMISAKLPLKQVNTK